DSLLIARIPKAMASGVQNSTSSSCSGFKSRGSMSIWASFSETRALKLIGLVKSNFKQQSISNLFRLEAPRGKSPLKSGQRCTYNSSNLENVLGT
ncbi:hypothetical protein Ancab_029103, partial [Ancistrocladus abbreviatus]